MLKSFLSAVKGFVLTTIDALGRVEGPGAGYAALALDDGKPKPKVRLVWAGNYQMFVDWCRNNDYHPNDRSKVRFIRSARDVRGYTKGDVIVVHAPGWWDHPDAYNVACAISCLF